MTESRKVEWSVEVSCLGQGWHEESRVTEEEGGKAWAEELAKEWRAGGCQARVVEVPVE